MGTAGADGWAAFHNNIPKDGCPYDPESQSASYTEWQKHYAAAKYEAAAKTRVLGRSKK